MNRDSETAQWRHKAAPTRTTNFNFARFVVSAMPFVVVGSLIYAAVYLKPAAKGISVPPAVVGHGDYMYGIAQLGTDRMLAVGSNGKVWVGNLLLCGNCWREDPLITMTRCAGSRFRFW